MDLPGDNEVPTADEIGRRMQSFREMCTNRGLRITPQRTEVFREVARTDEHPDADVVARRVRRRIPNISLDTVYRVLYRLEDEGLISRVQVSSGRLRFDGNAENHHHFVCSRCGLIRDFTSDELDHIHVPDEVSSWGAIEERHLMVRGICRQCLNQRPRRRSG